MTYTTYGRSPVVNRAFDELRREMFGKRLLTDDRFAKVEAAFTKGMKRPAIMSLMSDPFYGIKSKGRTGATQNLADQMAALPPVRLPRNPGQPLGRVFKSDARQSRFLVALKAGCSRNRALKLARHVTA